MFLKKISHLYPEDKQGDFFRIRLGSNLSKIDQTGSNSYKLNFSPEAQAVAETVAVVVSA